ncbi:MAG: hypothetical protein ABW123_04535 [Cystobacter sp.]
MRSLRSVLVLAVLSSFPVLADEAQSQADSTEKAKASPAEEKPKCEHGVQKALCTRCNPKLAAVFKAKGDWCEEHDRPESQCSLCHPDLAKKGVK